MTFRITTRAGRVAMVAALLMVFVPGLMGQDEVPSVLEVNQKSGRSVMVAGVTNTLVFSEEICNVEVSATNIRVVGLKQGETLVFLWTGDTRHEMLVKVGRPVEQQAVTLVNPAERGIEQIGHGVVGASVVTGLQPNGDITVSHADMLRWSQKVGDHSMNFVMESLGGSVDNVAPMAVNHSSFEYSTRTWDLNLLDSIVDLNGPIEYRLRGGSVFNQPMVRGAQFVLRRGDNTYSFFAGATASQSFLRWGGVRDIGGVSVRRRLSDRLSVSSLSAVTDQPSSFLITSPRKISVSEILGATFRANKKWAFDGGVGGSLNGYFAQAGADYYTPNRSAYLRVIGASGGFPLETMSLMSVHGNAVIASGTQKLTSRLFAVGNFQHNSTPAVGGALRSSVDVASGSLNALLTPREQVSVQYMNLSADQGGTNQTQRTTTASLSSTLGHGVMNSLQTQFGSITDANGKAPHSELHLFDTLQMSIGGRNTLFASGQYERSNASLISRIYANLSALPDDAQQAFLGNPQAFLSSPLLTPELRVFLGSLLPVQSEARVGGQFYWRDRIAVSPYLSWDRQQTDSSSNKFVSFGYTLSYQVSRGLTLRSSLTRGMSWDPRTQQIRNDTILMFGFVQSLSSATPFPFVGEWQHATISGTVFEDLTRTGFDVDGKHGVAGVTIELDNGRRAVTDDNGRFQFSGLRPGRYRARLPLSQFDAAIRVTTPIELTVEVVMTHEARVSFGIVRVAGLSGVIYNDYKLNGVREKDAPGIGAVRVIATGPGGDIAVTADPQGAFLFTNLPAGRYSLRLDPTSIPAGYLVSDETALLELSQAAKAYREIPLRAMRSIQGRVLLREPLKQSTDTPPNGSKPSDQFVPIAGVHVVAGDVTAISDTDGSFLLRGLPGGEITITVLPSESLPAGIKIPSWKLKMPMEPTEMHDVNIVIQSAELARVIASAARPGKAPTPRPPVTQPSAPADAPSLSTPLNGGSNTPNQPRVRERERERDKN